MFEIRVDYIVMYIDEYCCMGPSGCFTHVYVL